MLALTYVLVLHPIFSTRSMSDNYPFPWKKIPSGMLLLNMLRLEMLSYLFIYLESLKEIHKDNLIASVMDLSPSGLMKSHLILLLKRLVNNILLGKWILRFREIETTQWHQERIKNTTTNNNNLCINNQCKMIWWIQIIDHTSRQIKEIIINIK